MPRGAVLIGALVLTVAGIVVLAAAFAWPRGTDVDDPSAWVSVGAVDDFVVGEPVRNVEGKFYVVKLESGEFLALYQKDPHLGCTVPWNPGFEFQGITGWFRNPCHSETYTIAGECVIGPCPRGLDRFPVDVSGGQVRVNTSRLICGPGAPAGMVCTP